MTVTELRERCTTSGGTCYSRDGSIRYIENGPLGEINVYFKGVHVADLFPGLYWEKDTAVRFYHHPIVEKIARLYDVSIIKDYQ